eukprot:scaffold272922_cov23-Tisochrysis_lutea.AAC.1
MQHLQNLHAIQASIAASRLGSGRLRSRDRENEQKQPMCKQSSSAKRPQEEHTMIFVGLKRRLYKRSSFINFAEM